MTKQILLLAGLYFLLSPILLYSNNKAPLNINARNNGNISIKPLNTSENLNLDLLTNIQGCISNKNVKIIRKKGSVELIKTFYCDSTKTECKLTEIYTLNAQGIHCEIFIKGTQGGAWSMPIETSLKYNSANNEQLRYWTAWGSPNIDTLSIDASLRHQLREFKGGCDAAKGWAVLGGEQNNRWVDPLIPVPFTNSRYFYGATRFLTSDPMVGFVPAQNDLFAIPMAVIVDDKTGDGYSIILSPKDPIIDLELVTKTDGSICFKRYYNRISQENTLRFSFDIIQHSNDWRSGVAYAYALYPEYFIPKNKNAYKICGTGSYSASQDLGDVEKLKAIAFGINWQASFDFPYMGMFIPPLDQDDTWETFGYKAGVTKEPTQTIAKMNIISKKFKEAGFYSLSYFNVCEFGTGIVTPPPPISTVNEKDLWKNANDFTYGKLSNAILPVAKSSLTDSVQINAKYPIPYGTWGGAVAMDCGDSLYSAFLLDQAKKHIDYLPDSYGICIDRMDWLRMFNERADDNITWYNGMPARSLYNSWKSLMGKLGPMMHSADKVIYVNNHSRRIDLLNEVDGIFDEFTYMGNSMNLMALTCFDKPAMGWVDIAKTIENEGGDPFMQRHLYMGVFPMCPFEGNDHSIRPNPYIDQIYLDYGKMMQLLKGRKWVLTPHVINVENHTSKANIFKVDDGYIIPIVLGEKEQSRIILKGLNVSGIAKVYYPGENIGKDIKITKKGDANIFDVPLKRNCAFIHIQNNK